MIPVIAIVGRPNVGKSTLFNELTRSRDALVFDLPGVTRDRQYGEGRIGEKPFIVIDTGGLGRLDEKIDSPMAEQSWLAIKEADVVFFLVDGRSGCTASDSHIAQELRKLNKSVQLVVNKTDGLNPEVAMADFYALGFLNPIAIAAAHGRNVYYLIEHALKELPLPNEKEEVEKANEGIKIAISGRPNVGKSTLVNRLLGEDRVVVFDKPGTTRDSIYIPFERQQQKYTIIDTAGVRRRARVTETLEKFSVIKTLQAIEASHVVILVLDASTGISEQDLSLLAFILEAGRSLVIAVNKWDGLPKEQKEEIKRTLQYRLTFADFAKIHFISALQGTGVGNLFDSVQKAYLAATKKLQTVKLNKILEQAVALHPPPRVFNRQIKLRYVHAGGHNPPIIVIHGNQTEHVPANYRRYLEKTFRKKLSLIGTPIRIEFKTSENPFAGRRNTLTPRQKYKRERLKRFTKKKK